MGKTGLAVENNVGHNVPALHKAAGKDLPLGQSH